DTPVINLGFSGNAKFDTAVIDLIGQCDASIYLIDAMPNSYSMPVEMLKDTCYKAMRRLREARPETPILMIDHLGYPHGSTITERKQIADRGNAAQHEVYEQLIAEGMNDLYYLSYDEIALPQDATVEGVHPSDYGMVVLADKYEAKIREILNLPVGGTSTTTPITQNRDPYEWQDRHQKILAETQGKHYPAVIVGNSIVHFWSGDESNRGNGKQVWDKYLSDALNLGYGWDRIENTLWRVYHGEFEGYTADRIYVMLGTNNLASNSDDEIVEGLQNLWSQIAVRRPEADLVVVGILPRRNTEGRIKNLNKRLQGAAKAAGYRFADP
ncbi:MAG: acetylhydrolase, partial [Bacteroidales bacterium]|nr:acetylhydrolase [Bacteroidales bacterium]